MEARTQLQRIEDLESDNNTLRLFLADVQRENARLSQDFESLGRKCERLIAKVNEFVARFSVVQ
jgi:predicted nuclease with TOPRIM domain